MDLGGSESRSSISQALQEGVRASTPSMAARPSMINNQLNTSMDGTTLCLHEKLNVKVTSLDYYEEENMLVVGLVTGGIILMKILIEPAPMFSNDSVLIADEKNQWTKIEAVK